MQLDITYHVPTLEDEEILKDYIQEHYENGETSISASFGLTSMPYVDWVAKVQKMAIESSDGWGKSNLYLVCFNDHLIGLLNVRYEMSDELRDVYGNIGYGVRPSARHMGFATEMLKYGLLECKEHGLNKVVLGCVKDNVASAKTMLRCGGQLIKESDIGEYKPGVMKQYYQFRLEDEPQQQELLDLYDKDRNLTGETHVRGSCKVQENRYHLVVHIWIKNSEGKYLIAQRSAKRQQNQLKWECAGGSVIKGEDSLTGALREIKEEIGIDLDSNCGRVVFSRIRDVVNGERFADIMDVWLFNYDGDANLLNATTDEVAQTKWATVEEIKELYNKGELVQTLEYFFEKIANIC